MSTYTNRIIQTETITKVHEGSVQIGSWYTGPPDEVRPLLHDGQTVELEYRGHTGLGGRIVGWRIDGEWVYRQSDEDLAQEHIDMVARHDREREELLEKNRENWTEREAALPEYIRLRLDYFREKAGKNHFEINGWGYELVICELVVLYLESNFTDTDVLMEFSRSHGSSGNQHDIAKALAKYLYEDRSRTLYGTVAGLAPLTGSADYS